MKINKETIDLHQRVNPAKLFKKDFFLSKKKKKKNIYIYFYYIYVNKKK